jgi:hypothetical protein
MGNVNERTLNPVALDSLPPLPQVESLRKIASRLWGWEGVVALWLGGSLARGEADQFSDLDLRVAVADHRLKDWLPPDLSDLIGERVVGGRWREWDGSVFHHLLLASGIMLDLLVQGTGWEPPQDFTLILGCRDDAFAEKLTRAHLPSSEEPDLAGPEIIRQVIIDFWTDSHKHVKVLFRRLDMLALIGLGLEQSALMRLWYTEATGRDGGVQAGTIHSLTQTVRTVMTSTGTHGLEILGTPRADRADILHTVESNRAEVALVGRRLAERLGFEYPAALEQTVREAWRLFRVAEAGEKK